MLRAQVLSLTRELRSYKNYISNHQGAVKKKKKKNLIHAMIKLKDIMLSEISQIQKDRFFLSSLT